MKKYFGMISISLIGIIAICIYITNYSILPYDLSGTYSAGKEPSKSNIYVVVQKDGFTIYNAEKTLETGSLEKISVHNKRDMYKLSSNEGTVIGYLLYQKKRTILLNYNNKEIELKKISANALYIKYDS